MVIIRSTPVALLAYWREKDWESKRMGGGTMRTAAKAAVFGGYRSPGFYAAARRAPANAPSVVPAAVEGGPTVSLLASEVPRHSGTRPLSPIQRPSFEIDDWELTGWPEDGGLVRDSPTQPPVPRLVFGPVPTMEEAMEATSDLKDAVEKVYFSSTPTASATTTSSGHLDLAKQDSLAIIPAMPSDVIQAFSFLHRSPQAQEAVASLASDQNVWNAVMRNEKVMEFYTTHQSITYRPEQEDDSVSSVAENEHTNTSSEDATKSVFEEFVHNIKVRVEEIVSNISDFFQDLFGASSRTSSTSRELPESSNTGFEIGASFLALAVATIMVILVKRG